MIKKGEIVKNYLKKFTNTPSLTIAKKIYYENNELFKNIEDARNLIRYYRGLNGKVHRKKIPKQKRIKPFTFANFYNLPKSDASKPKIVNIKENNLLVISDIHIPYHDNTAISVALKYGQENNINGIVINGDLIDFFMISRFTNLERKRSVAEELEITKDFLSVLSKVFPDIPIYFLLGNHDNRLQAYLANKAPELLDVEEFRLEHLLEADKYNMKIFDDTTIMKAGKLNIVHGHLLLRGVFAPVNPARGAYLRGKSSTLIGHTHKVSTHSERTMNNKIITCYSTGSLCELNPSYQPYANNFMHGFAHVVVGNNGHYKVRNLQIINGELIN